jgi:hypothetical protein
MTRKLTGRSRPDRAQNVDLYWAGRLAKAQGPAQRAAIEWDRIRVEIERLPSGEREAAWSALTARLGSWRQNLAATDSEIHAGR